MVKTFGEFIEATPTNCEYLNIRFSPSSRPLQERWQNNGLSADFMADYLSSFSTGVTGASKEQQADLKAAVSYIANELLENAMKFGYAPGKNPVEVTLELHEQSIHFYVANTVDPAIIDEFQAFIHLLLDNDPEKMYLAKLDSNADSETLTVSGLGLLTLINDYDAQLGWQFTTVDDDESETVVTTFVRIPLGLNH
ncbi:MAG: ATP-binding protein [Chloroflexota bacterium]